MVKFGYFSANTAKRTGYITVAITRPIKDDPEQKHLCSFSFCSPKDSFSKVLGRRIAEGRLEINKCIELKVRGTIPTVIKVAMKEMIVQGNVPSWVLKAYKRNKLEYGLTKHS
jgi:hypothetical protein